MTIYLSSFSRQANIEDRNRLQDARPDAAIEEEIWDGILKDHSLGPNYRENIAVEVENGRVKLRGHVSKTWHSPLIGNIAGRVPGVIWVKNELLSDSTLQDQVIKALLQDEVTSPYIFSVKSSFGWIKIGGLVPSPEIARAAEVAAGFIPGVRGILSLPSPFGITWLAAEDVQPARRALQPRLAAEVLQDCDEAQPAKIGLVSQVIIDPCSRLVSAIGVQVNGKGAGQPGAIEHLVPMTAVEAVSEMKVWLNQGENIKQYAQFERSAFPLPPPGWQPPFPYEPGMVRWNL